MKYFIHLIILVLLILTVTFLNYVYKNDLLDKFNYIEDQYTEKFIAKYKETLEKKDDVENKKEIEEASKLFLKSYTNLLNGYLHIYSEADKEALLKNLETSLEKAVVVKDKKTAKQTPLRVMRKVLEEVLSVDPHTVWLYSPHYKSLLTSTDIGYHVKFKQDKKNNVIVVDNIEVKDIPLKKGDIILAINGVNIEGSKEIFTNEIYKQKINTLTTFTVKRGNIIKDYQLKFESYKQEILHSKVIDNKYLYIKLYQFSKEVDDLFFKALKDNKINSLKGLIIDLRNNPGGGMVETLIIANLFLSNKGMAAVENYREVEPKKEAYVSFKSPYVNSNIPIVVLTNGNSASGSEMLSGALALNNRAIIMGDTTYGKWTAQDWVVMYKEKVVNPITGSIFFVPVNDKLITFQGRGLAPDIQILPDKNSKKVLREEDEKNYIKAKKENYIDRVPKLKLKEKQCPVEMNNFPETEKQDKILGCAKLLLEKGSKVEVFAKDFTKEEPTIKKTK